jgi:chromosome segregation ATPase
MTGTALTPLASTKTMPTLILAAEELVKAACSHVESISLNAAKDTLESLNEVATKSSSSMEKSVEFMKESLAENLDSIKQSLAVNVESNKQSLAVNLDAIKQVDAKLTTLNSNIISLQGELANLNKTLEKQASTHKLEWAIANCDKISQPFTYYSYEIKGKSCDYTKSNSSTLIRDILLAFLRGEGCDISYRTMSRQSRDEGEKQFREAISKEVQAIIGQKPRIGMAEKGYAIYYT